MLFDPSLKWWFSRANCQRLRKMSIALATPLNRCPAVHPRTKGGVMWSPRTGPTLNMSLATYPPNLPYQNSPRFFVQTIPTIGQYRSWMGVCLPFAMAVYVCLCGIYPWMRYTDIYGMIAFCNLLNASLFPPTKFSGWREFQPSTRTGCLWTCLRMGSLSLKCLFWFGTMMTCLCIYGYTVDHSILAGVWKHNKSSVIV